MTICSSGAPGTANEPRNMLQSQVTRPCCNLATNGLYHYFKLHLLGLFRLKYTQCKIMAIPLRQGLAILTTHGHSLNCVLLPIISRSQGGDPRRSAYCRWIQRCTVCLEIIFACVYLKWKYYCILYSSMVWRHFNYHGIKLTLRIPVCLEQLHLQMIRVESFRQISHTKPNISHHVCHFSGLSPVLLTKFHPSWLKWSPSIQVE